MTKSSLRCPHSLIVALVPALAFAAFTAGCSSTSGGTPAGDAGSDAPSGPTCPAEADLISDFNMDNGVRPEDGRSGGWYTYADLSGLGTLMPPEGGGAMPDTTQNNPACPGMGSLRVKAMGYIGWGSATGTEFKPRLPADAGVAAKGTYDASKYRGISFYAKAAAPIKFVMVKFLDPYTEIPSVLPRDQWCAYTAMMPTTNCSAYVVKFGYGYSGEPLTAVMQDYPKYVDYKIDTTWKRFEVLFADAKQDRFNPGKQSPGNKLDTKQLVGMAIQFNSDYSMTPPGANDYEIWIDDVAFIK